MAAKQALALLFVAAQACVAVAAAAGEIEFTSPPTAVRSGAGAKIAFAVSAATDVEVAVLDGAGKVVRHLAAGRLGDAAPVPLTKGSLRQELLWDGTDDAGEPAPAGAHRVRVGLGLRPRLHHVIGWSGQDVANYRGLACGGDGTLYVVYGGPLYAHRTTTLISAFDAEGRYVRQVFPGPAGLPSARRAGWPHLTLDDGPEVPVVGHLLPRCLYPGVVFANRNFPAVTREGRLVVLGGSGQGTLIKHADVRGGRRLLILGTDGGAPADVLGPVVTPEALDGFGHVALSPDDRIAYVAGLFEGGKQGRGLCNVIWRVPLDGSGKAEVFAGRLYQPGGGADGLNDPQGLATDAKGNVCVADYGNGRIAAFAPDGSFLRAIPVEDPDQVRIHRRTGALYVLTLQTRTKDIRHQHYHVAAHNWKPRGVVKFASLNAAKPAATFDLQIKGMGGGAFLALDDAREPPAVWVAGLTWHHQGLLRLLDRGGRFEDQGDVLARRLAESKVPPMGFFGDVAVTGNRVLARHPGFGTGQKPTSQSYDAETGRFVGLFTPISPEGRTENYWNLANGEMVAGKDGNLYALNGKGELRRYGPDGRPLAFAATGTYVLAGLHHGHTRPAGLFVDRAGRIYIPHGAENRKLEDVTVAVIGPDGRRETDCAARVQVAKLGGIAVAPDGSIYLGAQIAPKGKRMPDWAAGKLPSDSPEHHPSLDYQQCGAIVKFPTRGGAILADDAGDHEAHLAWKSGGAVKLVGAEWVRRIGLHPVQHEMGCFCETTRFDVDGYGRVFVPDVFRFCVFVLDAAGSTIARIGTYGNMDSRGPASPVPEPEVAFGWPLSVQCARGKLYVADLTNRRVVSVRFEHAAEAVCDVK